MELWIRSQDKSNLKKVNNIYIEEITRDYDSWVGNIYSRPYVITSDNGNLGFYSTKERALEVLDEIQKLIRPTLKFNYEYDDSQPIIDGEWLKSLKAESKIEELSCYVYEMPKE